MLSSSPSPLVGREPPLILERIARPRNGPPDPSPEDRLSTNDRALQRSPPVRTLNVIALALLAIGGEVGPRSTLPCVVCVIVGLAAFYRRTLFKPFAETPERLPHTRV